MVASIVSAQSASLSELIAPFKRYVQSGEINFRVQDKEAMISQLAEKFSDGKQDRLDGLTVEYDDWWFNVRPSNTEPLLRLNLEASNEDLLGEKLREIESVLGQPVKE